MSPDAVTAYTREKDAIAFLGLLSYMYANWDAPIEIAPFSSTYPVEDDVTHYHGLNICALVVDNIDGGVMGMNHNAIHEYDSPVDHAEQRTIRDAIASINLKRPRGAGTTCESYIASQMFYSAGNSPSDYVNVGCTLYTTLEPCPMCTGTMCAGRMKRIIFVFPDDTFGGSFPGTQQRYYPSFQAEYQQLSFDGTLQGIAAEAQRLYGEMVQKVGAQKDSPGSFRQKGIWGTLFFDYLHHELRAVHDYFTKAPSSALVTTGPELQKNLNTLAGLKMLCNMPYTAAAQAATK